ncbi:MAG: class I SAM-dependent methyltransferase [Dehalobacterium sp.]
MVIIEGKIIRSVVELSHQLLSPVVHEGSSVIDATAGNGKDTLFLAKLVGETGKVYAFDIQEGAIEKTQSLLETHGMKNRVHLIQHGHELVDEYVDEQVQGVLFNLGYLPGGDHKIVTSPDTTICALKKSLNLLAQGGVLSIAVYWGHPGGLEEKNVVDQWVEKLSPREWDVMKINFPNKNMAPYVIGVQKKLWEA